MYRLRGLSLTLTYMCENSPTQETVHIVCVYAQVLPSSGRPNDLIYQRCRADTMLTINILSFNINQDLLRFF